MAKKRAQMRRSRVPLGDIRRNAAGEIEMIQFEPFKDNPLAPTALVSKVGGIYRMENHLIRVTFIDDVPNAEGQLEAIAQGHLIWKTPQDWLATRDVFGFAMAEFRRGSFFGQGRRQ